MGKTWSYAKGGPTDPPKKIPVSGYRRPDGLWEMPNGETYANPEPFVLKEERYTAGNYPAVNGKVPIGRKYIVYNDPAKQDGWQEFAEGGPIKPPKKIIYYDNKESYRKANQAYQDSTTLSNLHKLKLLPKDTPNVPWSNSVKDHNVVIKRDSLIPDKLKLESWNAFNRLESLNGKPPGLSPIYYKIGLPNVPNDYYESWITPFVEPTSVPMLREFTQMQPKTPELEQKNINLTQLEKRPEVYSPKPQAINTYSAAGYPMVGGKTVPSGRIHDGKTWSIIE